MSIGGWPGIIVTAREIAGFFRQGFQMNSDPTKSDGPHPDPLEDNELARRLRRMEWPPAPPEVKERILDRVLEEAERDRDRADRGAA